MKTLYSFFLALFVCTGLAQQTDPVKWMATYNATSENEGIVIIKATIDKGWHTYSQRPTDAGPIPTSIHFEKNNAVELIGKTEESDAHEEFVPAFEAKIFVFTGKAEFRQKVKAKKGQQIACTVEYMSCNDKMCLPPKIAELKVKVQ